MCGALSLYARFLGFCDKPVRRYYCDQKILETSVIVLSYILKRPLCINNFHFDCCVNFENVCQIYRQNIQEVLKIRQME
jgi:hypothetical protein